MFSLDGATILITGGTGSFGKAIVRKILPIQGLVRVIVFSRDEYKQYELAESLPEKLRGKLHFLIGDVRDRNRLLLALRDVDYVIHAAAMKQICAAEAHPFECISTNVIGAENLISAALGTGVKRIIALSTDKACAPANLYGASKLAAERLFVAANRLSGENGCRFSVVRYGNVIGSRGSVLPLFSRLIAEGAKILPITDERMTRFWISLSQGVEFVLSCLAVMRGGEIYIPKIPSMKIVDVARTLASQIEFSVVGIRPGEKLHEVLVTQEDALSTLDLGDRYVIKPIMQPWYKGRALGGTEQGRLVPAEFEYASNNNVDWLDADRFRRLLAESAVS